MVEFLLGNLLDKIGTLWVEVMHLSKSCPTYLPPTGHSGGLDHFCVLIPFPVYIFGGLIPGGTTRLCPIIIVFLFNHCASTDNFNILSHPSENAQAAKT